MFVASVGKLTADTLDIGKRQCPYLQLEYRSKKITKNLWRQFMLIVHISNCLAPKMCQAAAHAVLNVCFSGMVAGRASEVPDGGCGASVSWHFFLMLLLFPLLVVNTKWRATRSAIWMIWTGVGEERALVFSKACGSNTVFDDGYALIHVCPHLWVYFFPVTSLQVVSLLSLF